MNWRINKKPKKQKVKHLTFYVFLNPKNVGFSNQFSIPDIAPLSYNWKPSESVSSRGVQKFSLVFKITTIFGS